MKVATLTISDRSKHGIYEDKSGPKLVAIIQQNTDWQVVETDIVADDLEDIKFVLEKWCVDKVNPEATRLVIEKEALGISEALRSESLKITPFAMLSRGVAGIKGTTLIINLPGNPKAVEESMMILLPVLPHALELLVGDDSPHVVT